MFCFDICMDTLPLTWISLKRLALYEWEWVSVLRNELW